VVSPDRYKDALAAMLSIAAICVHDGGASQVHRRSTLLLSDLKARSGSAPPMSLRIFSSDDLKERKMREVIRFAWGISSLGDFMVAVSDKGLVVLELGSSRGAMEEALRNRFPDAEVVNSQVELVNVLDKITRVIEEPGFDPELPLDMRGTSYEIKVWSMLRALPIGETISYGALAAKLGTRDARDVTKAIASNPIAVLVPCHRVIKKDGSISGYRWGVKRKRELLARERRAKPRPTSEGDE
jgi:AraC family transcriptional regulator, regulatory protein of adaptative response / methylated-DNA-[protein]-cysteine methyltransferase